MNPPLLEAPSPDAGLPLSFGQEQLWFLAQLLPGAATYNVARAFRLTGALDATAVRRALRYLVARHESLRSSFGAADGVPFQLVHPSAEPDLLEHDLSTDPDGAEVALERALAAEAATPFDLEQGPLCRFRLFRLAADQQVLVVAAHHIVIDGWSMGIVLHELSAAYEALIDNRDPALPEPELRYVDHVARQRAAAEGAWDVELKYWQGQLAGLPELELPADRLRPAASTNAGDVIRVGLPDALVPELRRLASSQGVSLFMILAAALNVLLSRYTGEEDIPVGVPILGRLDPELEGVVGLFVNMTVLRTVLTGDPTFVDLVERVAETALDLHDHEDVPFDRVVERVQPVRDAGRNPLFQVSIQLLGGDTSGLGLRLPGVVAEPIPLTVATSRFDVAFNFVETATGLDVDVEYSTELFDRWRLEAMVGHLTSVLRSVVANPAQRLSQIELLGMEERAEILAAGRGEPVVYTTQPVHAQISAVARSAPDALAAVCRGRELSYGELDRRSDLLARYLRARGIGQEQVVAILLDRDLDVLVGMLGVLKAGGAFAVMDPRHPAKRLQYMLTDTAAPVVLSRAEFAELVPRAEHRDVVLLDADWATVAATPADEPLAEIATRDSLAYVLYTSGSTGNPKGVLVEHRALTCFTEAYRRTFGFTSADRMLQLPAITFDMSHGEIFTALTVGSTLVLVSYEEGRDPELVAELMRAERVTFGGFSPAMLSLVEAGPYPELRSVMNGGDVLPGELVNKWNLPGRRFVNLYGPTEAVIACTEYECEQVEWRSTPPIGRVQLNRQAYVLDRHGNLLPRGVPGELYIGGPEGLARGYLNAPELTAAKFVTDVGDASGRTYRTGDLVRWTHDYQLDFIGRIDTQVKMRGLRIELGEIEAALNSHPAVRLSTVLLMTDPRGEKQLVAYLTAMVEPLSIPDLTDHLRRHVPEYMVPAAWVVLNEFPLTAARKIDRKSLPAPDVWGRAEDHHAVEVTDPTARAVAEIYAEVLGLNRVGAEDTFFTLGGNSLQAMRVISRINRRFGIRINLRSLYGAGSVESIAVTVRAALGESTGTEPGAADDSHD